MASILFFNLTTALIYFFKSCLVILSNSLAFIDLICYLFLIKIIFNFRWVFVNEELFYPGSTLFDELFDSGNILFQRRRFLPLFFWVILRMHLSMRSGLSFYRGPNYFFNINFLFELDSFPDHSSFL